MDVLGHDDVAEAMESIFETDRFEGVLEDARGLWAGEVGIASGATEGDEVEVAGLLSSFQAGRHDKRR